MIDLWSLKVFRTIADQGSLSRASAILGVSQSTLSRHVSGLEAAIGGRLFHRNGRGVVLTELGVLVRPRADGVLTDVEGMLGAARKQTASPAGEVDLGLVRAVGPPLPSRLALRLDRDFPRIRLRLHEGFSGQIVESLATGRIEVGVFNRYGKGRIRGGTLLFTTDMVVVSRRGRRGTNPRQMPFSALAGLRLAVPLSPNALTAVMKDAAARQGMELNLALEAGSASIIRDVVSNAGYSTVLPRHVALNDYGERGFSISAIAPSIVQTTWLSTTTQRPVSEAARVVARLVRESCRDLVRDGTWAGPTIARA